MPKLLITDDDLHLRKLVRTYAEVDGYACEEAENGFQALEKLQSGQFDLMILDITVSYTHLDVYKRQALWASSWLFPSTP